MPTRYLLLDFENVQPANLAALQQPDTHVLVFVGANQSKIPLETAMALQQLGKTAAYVQIAGSGPNALDFHIAYYIGKLAAEQKDAQFHIVSKDRGFDPLIEHLRVQGILVTRGGDVHETTRTRSKPTAASSTTRPASARVAGVRVAAARVSAKPAAKPAAPKSPSPATEAEPEPMPSARVDPVKDPIAYIIDRLRRLGAGRPRTLKTLTSSINALFDKQLTRTDLEVFVDELARRGHLKVTGTSVSYSL